MKQKPSMIESALSLAHKYFGQRDETHIVIPKPDELGYIRIKYDDLKILLKERRKSGWAEGACYMLASIHTDERKGRKE